MRIEIVGGNRIGAAVSSLRQLSFGEKKKMRFSRGEMVFHRLEIRVKTAYVAEVKTESVCGSTKTSLVVTRRVVRPGDIYGPLPRW